MTIQQYSEEEALQRILLGLTGQASANDEPETLTGILYPTNESLSRIAELLQGSLDGERLIIPPVATSGITNITTATYTIQLTGVDTLYHVTRTSTGACTITINTDLITSSIFMGKEFTIKDAGINADVYNITLHTQGSEKIEGSTDDFVMNLPGQSLTLYTNGTDLFIK